MSTLSICHSAFRRQWEEREYHPLDYLYQRLATTPWIRDKDLQYTSESAEPILEIYGLAVQFLDGEFITSLHMGQLKLTLCRADEHNTLEYLLSFIQANFRAAEFKAWEASRIRPKLALPF